MKYNVYCTSSHHPKPCKLKIAFLPVLQKKYHFGMPQQPLGTPKQSIQLLTSFQNLVIFATLAPPASWPPGLLASWPPGLLAFSCVAASHLLFHQIAFKSLQIFDPLVTLCSPGTLTSDSWPYCQQGLLADLCHSSHWCFSATWCFSAP